MIFSGFLWGREAAVNCLVSVTIGILLDFLFADSHGFPHPIRLIGRWIEALEEKFYGRGSGDEPMRAAGRFLRGCLLAVLVLLTTGIYIYFYRLAFYKLGILWGRIGDGVLFYFSIASKSLYLESMAVIDALEKYAPDLNPARKRLSWIVGRDTGQLSEEKIISAAVETVAENTSDGVIAPFFYMLLLGPMGAGLYKAVNTMDSMLGYRNLRYEFFGKAAARLDDVCNLIPSRVSAVLMILGSFILKPFLLPTIHPIHGLRIWMRDHGKHKSPNSAQTEAACAGILGVCLGGDAVYFGKIVEKPGIGDPLRRIQRPDVDRSNRLMFLAMAEMYLLAILVFLICYMR